MSIETTQELKSLNTRIKKLQAEYKDIEEEIKALDRKKFQIFREQASLRQRVFEIEQASKEPVVTEHAMLRYFERVHGFNLEQIKKDILTPEVTKMIKEFKSGKFPVDNGYKFKVVSKDKTIVTIET